MKKQIEKKLKANPDWRRLNPKEMEYLLNNAPLSAATRQRIADFLNPGLWRLEHDPVQQNPGSYHQADLAKLTGSALPAGLEVAHGRVRATSAAGRRLLRSKILQAESALSVTPIRRRSMPEFLPFKSNEVVPSGCHHEESSAIPVLDESSEPIDVLTAVLAFAAMLVEYFSAPRAKEGSETPIRRPKTPRRRRRNRPVRSAKRRRRRRSPSTKTSRSSSRRRAGSKTNTRCRRRRTHSSGSGSCRNASTSRIRRVKSTTSPTTKGTLSTGSTMCIPSSLRSPRS
jgi:hypothetical protein